jgi:hypothetical protein
MKERNIRPNLNHFLVASLRICGGPGLSSLALSVYELESPIIAAKAVIGRVRAIILNFIALIEQK